MSPKPANASNEKVMDLKRYSKSNFGERLADQVALKAGSWGFIISFVTFLILWMILNSVIFIVKPWDPFPFILLNLVLSTVAAIQAPIILMSQNRSSEFDRRRAEMDYYINRKAEREIKILQKDILELKSVVMKQPLREETDAINNEIKKIEAEIKTLKDYHTPLGENSK